MRGRRGGAKAALPLKCLRLWRLGICREEAELLPLWAGS